MDIENKELHVKLQELRDEKGLKNTEIAQKLDVSDVSVSNWMTGTSIPGRKNLKALADLFNVPISYLNGVNEENKEEINHLLDRIDYLQTENSHKDQTIKRLSDALDYQRKTLLVIIGAVLLIGAAVFRSTLHENVTTSQAVVFLLTVAVGSLFLIAGVAQFIVDRVKKDIHSAEKDADSRR